MVEDSDVRDEFEGVPVRYEKMAIEWRPLPSRRQGQVDGVPDLTHLPHIKHLRLLLRPRVYLSYRDPGTPLPAHHLAILLSAIEPTKMRHLETIKIAMQHADIRDLAHLGGCETLRGLAFGPLRGTSRVLISVIEALSSDRHLPSLAHIRVALEMQPEQVPTGSQTEIAEFQYNMQKAIPNVGYLELKVKHDCKEKEDTTGGAEQGNVAMDTYRQVASLALAYMGSDWSIARVHD